MRAAAALCAVAVSGAFAPAAAAHDTDPSIASVADGVTPALPGVTANVVYSVAPELTLVNRSRSDVEVLGRDGSPFLRIGRRGVLANLASPAWYESNVPGGGASVPPQARGAPRWVRVSRQPGWAWFDERLYAGVVAVPPRVRAAARRAVLGRWSIPLRAGPRRARVTGHAEFRPLLGALVPRLTSPPSPVAGLSAVVLPGRVPGLFVTWGGRGAAVIIGRAGEPFARLTTSGVEVNQHSPTHLDDLRARGQEPRVAADAAASPLWRRVADVPRYAWLDSRARYPAGQPPASVSSAAKRVELVRWSIPVVAAGRRVAVQGATDWVPGPEARPARRAPRDGGFPVGWAIAAGVAALLVLGAVTARVIAARRR